MRKSRLFLLIFMVMLMALPLSAQDLKITKIATSRLITARVNRETDPISGEECAVLHIKTEGLTPEERNQLDFQLDQASTIVKTLKDGGEILMYVPPRTVLLVVKSPFGNYRADFRRDFGFKDGTVELTDYDVYIEYNRPAPGPVVPEIKEEVVKEAEVFTVVEEMPSFPGGPAKMTEYIAKNMKYPKTAHKNGVEGRVFVNFVVEPDGSISNIKVLRGIGDGCDEEAMRIVRSMPTWKPGKFRGKAVRVNYTVPIVFKVY